MITAEKIALHFKMADLGFAERLYADWDYFYIRSLVDVLDSYLSTYDSDDIYLEIDRLDLDLGEINQEEFYDEFPRRLRRELERQFRVALINNTTLTQHNIAEWLSSPTLSRHEKQARLERLLMENPHLVTRFIHDSRDESERKGLSEILEHKLVRQIIYTESESHAEVGLAGYWYALYCWLYEYYPFSGVDTFGDKQHFKQYLNVKLLSFIHKRGYSEYLSKRDLTLQFVKEIFSERYYINVLRAICQNQSLDKVGRPLCRGYYIWEIYTLLLEIGVVTPPKREIKNSSSDLIYWNESEKVENLLLTLRGEATGDRDIIRYFSKRRAQELLRELKSTHKEMLFAMCDDGSMERESVVELLSSIDSSQASVVLDLVRYVEQRVVGWGIFVGSSAELTSSLTKAMLLIALYLMELGDGVRLTKEEIANKFLSIWHSVLGGDGKYEDNAKWQRVKHEILESNEIKEPNASIKIVEEESEIEQRQGRDRYIIPNAGLSLLSPWFPRLFGILGLLTKDQRDFVDREAKVRAIFILQRLVRSQESQWRDSELVFNRILVDLPFSYPLPKRMELTREEINVIESMLQGVKTNWGVMKNTSIEGLQSSFIERGGEIRLENDGWRLRVEPRSFDMLLDSLPWAYSLIRLPWLERWITVSWREIQEFDN